MVAFVSGNGLGLFNTSLSQLGLGFGGSSGIGQSRGGQFVNLATGNLVLQSLDESLRMRGFETCFMRTYNSRGNLSGLGDSGQDGFQTGYERRVIVPPGTTPYTTATPPTSPAATVSLVTGDGDVTVFTWDTTLLKYEATDGAGAHDTLSWNASSQQWTYVEGSTRREELYDATGRLTRIRDLTSDPATPAQFDLIYDAQTGRLKEVRSLDGAADSEDSDAIVFEYDGAGRLSAITTREGDVVKCQQTYAYDSYGRLLEVITDLTPGDATGAFDNTTAANNDSLRYRTRYTYKTASASDLRISSVWTSDGVLMAYEYDASNRISRITQGTGATAQVFDIAYGDHATTVTDAYGKAWVYRFDDLGRMTSVEAPAVDGMSSTTYYVYDTDGNVTQVRTERGTGNILAQTDRTYNASGCVLEEWTRVQGGNAASTYVLRTYNAANQLLTETRYSDLDANGSASGSTPTNGITTNYIYDSSNRLRYIVDSQGSVTEFAYGGAASGNAIGQVTLERRFLVAYVPGANPNTLAELNTFSTTYRASATLTQYTYDAKGRLKSALQCARVDANGVAVIDDNANITQFTYDAQGLLLQRIVVRGNARSQTGAAQAGSEVTDYVYDGMGRLLSVLRRDAATAAAPPALTGVAQTDAANQAAWDAATQLTVTTYVDSARQILVTTDTGVVRTQSFDQSGLQRALIETGGGVTRTSRNYYDNTGRLRAAEDANGARTYYFYDEAGQLVGQVDGTGAVLEFVRDGRGLLIDTIAYEQRVDTTGWLTGTWPTNGFLHSTLAAIRPTVWSTGFSSLPISGLNTACVDNPAYNDIITWDGTNGGRLVFRPGTGTAAPNVQRTGTHTLAEGVGYSAEVTIGPSQNNTYLLLSLQNMDAGAALRRAGVYFRNGNLYLNTVNGASSANTLVGTTTANTTYVVTMRTRDGVIEFNVYDKKKDPTQGIRFTQAAGSADWGDTRVVAFGLANQATPGDAIYLDELREITARHADRTYDGLGRLLTQTSAAGVVTTYEYDGLSRLLKATVTGAGATPRVTRYFYDNAGRQTGTLDAEGYLTETVYDTAGRAIRSVRYATATPNSSAADATRRASGTWGELIGSIATTANDQTTRMWYDSRDQLVATLSAEGYLTEFVYDERNNQRSVKSWATRVPDPSKTLAGIIDDIDGGAVRITQRSFNGLGQLVTELNAENTVTRYTYDEAGRLVTTTQADNTDDRRAHNLMYDVFGNIVAELTGVGSALLATAANQAAIDAIWAEYRITHTYDLVGRRIETTDPQGNKTWYFYDNNGRQTFLVRGNTGAAGQNSVGEVVETRYSAFGEVIDSIAYTGLLTIPTPGNRTSVLDALTPFAIASAVATRRSLSYDLRGLLTRTTDGLGVATDYTYNAFGELQRERRAVGTGAEVTVDRAYDARGLETSRTEAAGTGLERTVSHTYDAFGRVVAATDARGNLTSFTYDRLGRQVARSQTVGSRVEAWSTTYDAFDRVLSQTDAMGRTTSYSYSDANRSVTVTTPESVAMTTARDRLGQTISVTTAAGTTTYTYDDDGHLLTTTRPGLAASASTYDDAGRLYETIDASGRRVRYAYDGVGRVLTVTRDPTDADAEVELNLVTTYTYDAQGRQLTVTDATGRVTKMTYDHEGRVLTVTRDPTDADADAELNLVTTYTWDAAGRQLTVTEGAGAGQYQVAYAYDALGRRISETVDPSNLALLTTYIYDKNGNLVARTDATGAINRFYYDAANRQTHAVDANGGIQRMWYDLDGRIVATRRFSVATNAATLTGAETTSEMDGRQTWTSGADIGDYRVYDGDGRLTYVIDSVGRVTRMTYDDADRLIATRSFATSLTLTSELTTAMFAGDMAPDGVTTQVVSNDAFDAATYTIYDAAGRARFTVTSAGTTEATVVENFYDAAGRLTQALRYPAKLTETGYSVGSTSLLVKVRAGSASVADMTVFANATNRVTAHRDILVYDGAGRLKYSINALLQVTETHYDAADRVTGSRRLAAAITDSTLATQLRQGTALYGNVRDAINTLADDSRDAQTFVVHDSAGRVIYQLDGAGQLTQQRYDAAGRVVETIAYATPVALDPTLRAALRAGAGAIATQTAAAYDGARATFSLYDAAGRVLYRVVRTDSGQAAVVGLTYDAVGRLVGQVHFGKTIAYDASSTAADIVADLDAVDAELPQNQRVTRFAYDAVGQLRFTVDDAGAVVEKRYNAVGAVVELRTYGNIFVVPNASVGALEAAVGAETNVRIASYVYTANGLLYKRIDGAANDATAANERYVYDGIGRLTQRVDRLNRTWVTAYDAAGRVLTETSPAVNVARFDSSGNVVVESRAVVTQYEYDGLGNLISRIENAGAADVNERRKICYEYDLAGRQTRTIFPQAGAINPLTGLLDATTDPQADTIVTYDAFGRAVVQQDVRERYSYRVYDAQGALAYEVDAKGHVTAYTYNAYGEVESVRRLATEINMIPLAGWSAGSPITLAQIQTSGVLATSTSDRILTSQYDRLGRRTQVTQGTASYVNAAGATVTGTPTTRFTYDAYGNLVKEAVLLEGSALDGTGVWATTFHYYDELGRRVLAVDAEGYVTTYAFNAMGELVAKTEYARTIPTGVLDPTVRPLTPLVGDAFTGFDRSTLWTYDALGRKASETQLRIATRLDGSTAATPFVTTFEYDKEGRTTASIVNGVRSEMTYDALGRTTSVTEASRLVLVDDYLTQLQNNAGYTLSTTSLYLSASPYSTMAYDAFGNAVKVVRYARGWRNGAPAPSAADQTETTRYDRQGRAVMIRNANGHALYNKYDAADHVIESWHQLSDSDDNSVTVRTLFTYDDSGRQLTSITRRETTTGNEIDRQEAVRYNAFGEVVAKGVIDADLDNAASSAQFEYDVLGRLIRSNAQGGSFRRFGYNLAGFQVREERDVRIAGADGVTLMDAVAVTRQITDRLGRVVLIIAPAHGNDAALLPMTTRRYDRWGNVLEQTDPRGFATQWYYNDRNQVVREVRPLVKVVTAQGVESWLRPEVVTTYDAFGRVVSVRDANGNVRQTNYDAGGLAIATIDGNGAITRHAYDALGQRLLTQDARGYLTFRTYDELGQLESHGDLLSTNGTTRVATTLQTLDYDEDGNCIRVTDALSHTTRYDYDSASGLLRSRTAAGITLTYGYDDQGRRVSETNGLAATQTWTYDYFGRLTGRVDLGGQVYTYTNEGRSGLLSTQSGNAAPTTAVPGGNEAGIPGENQPVLTSLANTRTYYYYANGLVRRIEEPGGVWYRYEYDAAGNRTLEETSTVDGRGMVVHQITRTVFDSHGRASRVSTDKRTPGSTTWMRIVDITYSYDAVGNRRRVEANSGFGPGVSAPSSANLAPQLVGTARNITIKAGTDIDWRLRTGEMFRDPEGKPLSVSVTLSDNTPLPAWLTADAVSRPGEIAFRAAGAAAGQTITVKVRATDEAGAIVQNTFTITVVSNSAPTLFVGGVGNLQLVTGQAFDQTLFASQYFREPDLGDALTLSVVSISPAASWLTVDTSNPAGVRFSCPAGVAVSGTYTIRLRATDGSGAYAEKYVQLQVQANAAPVAQPIPPQDAYTGRGFLYERPLEAVFADANIDPLTVTATLAGGGALPSWLTLESLPGPGPRVRLIGQVPPDAAETTYSIVLTAQDGNGAIVTTAPFDLRILDGAQLVGTATSANAMAGWPFTQTWSLDALLDYPVDEYVSLSLDANETTAWMHLAADPAAGTFTLSGIPTTAAVGQYLVNLRATDWLGNVTVIPISFNVAAYVPNHAPTFQTPASVYLGIGQAFDFSMAATDVDGDAISYYAGIPRWDNEINQEVIDELPNWLTFNASTGRFSGTAPASSPNLQIRVYANYGSAQQAAVMFTLSVTANQAPVPGLALGNQSVPVNSSGWSYVVPAFTDAENDALIYTTSALPAGLSFNATTRTFSGTPTVAGNYTVTVTASDGYRKASASFQIRVEGAPVAVPGLVLPGGVAGQAYSFVVPTTAFTDPNGDAITLSVSGLPCGLSWDAATRTLSGTPASSGSFTITLTATANAQSTSRTLTLAIDTSNAGPVVAIALPNQYTSSTSFYYQFAANCFTDPEGQSLTYSATLSNGAPLPSWLSFNPVTRTFSGATPSQYQYLIVRVTATDARGASVSDDFVLEVDSDVSNRLRPAASGNQGYQGITAIAGVVLPATSNMAGTAVNRQDYWFTYDGENRVRISNGVLVDIDGAGNAPGCITLVPGNGYELYYDAMGNNISEATVNTSGFARFVNHAYDLRGRLVFTTAPDASSLDEARRYNDAGQLVQIRRYYRNGETYNVKIGGNPDTYVQVDVGGLLHSSETYTLDADGRTQLQSNRARINNWPFGQVEQFDESAFRALHSSDVNVLTETSQVAYSTESGPAGSGYDAAGRLMTYRVLVLQTPDNPTAYNHTYTYTYIARDTYLEATIAGVSSMPELFKAATTTSYYDAFGRRIAVKEFSEATENPRLRYFGYDGNGQILTRRDGTLVGNAWTQTASGGHLIEGLWEAAVNPIEQLMTESAWQQATNETRAAIRTSELNRHYVYTNGQMVAELGQGGSLEVRKYLTGFTSNDNGDQTRVIVQGGDTLRSLAAKVYGTETLWYVLAEANGLEDGDLVEGLTLKVPAVQTNSNDASTFEPYDPNALVGSTTPDVAYVAPPSRKNCSTLGMFVAIVVTIVVTWATGGNVYIGAAAGNTAGQAVTAMERGEFDWGRAIKLYLNPMGGSLQDFERRFVNPIENGMPDTFSRTSVAISVAAAGAASGISGAIGGAAGAVVTAAVQAISTAVISYTYNKIAGKETAFSWREIAASAVASGITAGITGSLGFNTKTPTQGYGLFGQDLAGSIIGSVVSYHVRRRVGLEANLDFAQIAADAFGNAIGNQFKRSYGNQAQPPEEVHAPELTAGSKPGFVSNIDLSGWDWAWGQQSYDTTVAFGGQNTTLSAKLDVASTSPTADVSASPYTMPDAVRAGLEAMIADTSWRYGTRGMRKIDILDLAYQQIGQVNPYHDLYAPELEAVQVIAPHKMPRHASTWGNQDAGHGGGIYQMEVLQEFADFSGEFATYVPAPVRTGYPGGVTASQWRDSKNRASGATQAFEAIVEMGRPGRQLVDIALVASSGSAHDARERARQWLQNSDSAPEAAAKFLPYAFTAMGDTLSYGLEGARVFTSDAVRQSAFDSIAYAFGNPREAIGSAITAVMNMSPEDMAMAGWSMLSGGALSGRASTFLRGPTNVAKPAVLLTRTGQLSGVARFDAPFAESAQASRMISALERRGVSVIDNAARLAPGESARVFMDDGRLSLLYDSKSTSFLDMLHETRHVAQVQRAQRAGVLGQKDIFESSRLRGAAERGAYEYEMRLGSRFGFSNQYMGYLRGQVREYYPPSFSYKFNASPTMRSIFHAMEPGLRP